MSYLGVIIEESLKDTSCLEEVKIVKTEFEKVTESHQTPHLNKWTLHTVEVEDDKADSFAQTLSRMLLDKWYADYKNFDNHYIIFKDKVFKLKRGDATGYAEAKSYGMEQGIPDYQLDFSSNLSLK